MTAHLHLDAVIAFYNRVGDSETGCSSLIRPLNLNANEQWSLVAVSNALTDPVPVEVPKIPGLADK